MHLWLEFRFGYLIDYRGILKELDTTIEKYQDLAERTQGGFDVDDLKGLYNRMDTEYKKLPGLYSTLWAIFDGVKNKQDPPALRQALAPKVNEVQEGAFPKSRQIYNTTGSVAQVFSIPQRPAL